MTNPIRLQLENKKPFEIIQELEERQICWAEPVQAESYEENNFAYAHIAPPRTKKTPFRAWIKLENCYFTEASTLTSLLQLHNTAHFLPITKIEKVKELLEDLETDYLRIVNWWGYETQRTSSLKKNLIKQLKEIVRGYENQGTINRIILIEN